MWEAFAARFPYQETDDQLAAIADVVADLEKGSPMDRLIVGDVGFGKTEVAMRAAFVAALSGMQVAVICPTTLLARQHYRSFAERFRGFPIKVRPCRALFQRPEAAPPARRWPRATVDIVVGTHALLAKGVSFKQLGLLVIDEEQHFGVAHKERLKEMRSEVHVLTLTATPIPRTLQLADRGARSVDHRHASGGPAGDPHLCVEFDTVTLREACCANASAAGSRSMSCRASPTCPRSRTSCAPMCPRSAMSSRMASWRRAIWTSG
jgi:transcription-repair coupling factor (superfamily II helicase)